MRAMSICILLLASLNGLCQPRLSASTTRALIGDHLELYLEIPASEGTEWVNSTVTPGDTVEAIEVVETFPPERTTGTGITGKWKIAVFDTGYVYVPPVPVVLRRGSITDTMFSNDIPLYIEGVVDSLGFAPIKPIIYEPVQFSDYLPYIAIAGGLLLLVVLAVYWYRRPKKAVEVVEIRDEKPPHVIAFERLNTLENAKLWEKGLIREYHSELNHIVREYLEGRYGIRALESTTGEIVAQLRSLDLSEELQQETARMLQLEDLVKFAKATPPVDVHAKHLEFVRSFVRQTRPAIIENTEADV